MYVSISECRSVLYNLFDMAYTLVMSYVAGGMTLDSLRFSSRGGAHHLTPHALSALGRVLVLDLLLNNGYACVCVTKREP
jgi:hypothetical protein